MTENQYTFFDRLYAIFEAWLFILKHHSYSVTSKLSSGSKRISDCNSNVDYMDTFTRKNQESNLTSRLSGNHLRLF